MDLKTMLTTLIKKFYSFLFQPTFTGPVINSLNIQLIKAFGLILLINQENTMSTYLVKLHFQGKYNIGYFQGLVFWNTSVGVSLFV